MAENTDLDKRVKLLEANANEEKIASMINAKLDKAEFEAFV